MNVQVSVIIPNWNGRRFLDLCLGSLRRQTYRAFETILVDNGSTDGSAEHVRLQFPEIRLIQFSENLGFSAAANEGIQSAKGDYIALLNTDVEVDPRWLSELVLALERHAEVDFCASKILKFEDRRIIDSVGVGCIAGGIGYPIGSHEEDHGQYESPMIVLGSSAGASMYRKAFFDQVGLFDETFFAYHEDVDLNLRAQWAGRKCLYVPTAAVYHIGGGSTGGGLNYFIVRLSTRNRIHAIVKNLPLSLIVRAAPRMLMYEGIWIANVWARGSLRAYAQGLWEALLQFREMARKRRQIFGSRQVDRRYFVRATLASEQMVIASVARRGALSPTLRRLLRIYQWLVPRVQDA